MAWVSSAILNHWALFIYLLTYLFGILVLVLLGFVLFCFEAGFLCVALAGLELTL